MTKRNRPITYLTLDNVTLPGEQFSRAAALRTLGEVVYAVRIGDVVKIGHTTNLANRFISLRANEVLAFKPGTLDDEQAIHADLDGQQHHGVEYYFPTPAVMAVVNEMREALGLHPMAA